MMEEIYQMIEDCQNRESKLFEWESDFIQSISEKDHFTEKQIAKLENIWERVTSK